MRKRRIAVELFAMMIAVTGVFHGSINVNAATKKITVDQTYENATNREKDISIQSKQERKL